MKLSGSNHLWVRAFASVRVIRITLLVVLSTFAVFGALIVVRHALAAEVIIDDTPEGIDDSHNGSSPTVVFISDQTGYAFYRDATSTNCKYRKTTDGGTSWGAPVTVDAQNDCVKIAVWYDRWTPGDNTGTNIHIATMDTGDDDLFYTRLNTAGDTLTTTVNASAASAQGGTFTNTQNIPSITKGTDGDLYMGVQDDADSYVIKCTTTCESASNWTEAGTNPFDPDHDWLILMPLSGGNILAIRWDVSAGDIQSKTYNDALNTWDLVWTNIDTSANTNLTYDASFGATLNKATNTIYLAYAADVDTLGTNDDIRTASYNGGVWTAQGAVLTNDARGVTGVKVATKENTEAVFVIYTARTTPGTPNTANLYYKMSTDGMTTFGAEQGPLNSTPGDLYGARVNIISDERIYATWYEATGADLFGNTVADLAATAVELASFEATHTDNGVLLEWRTGFESDNLGFNIYRVKDGRRTLVNPSIIAGSAFSVGSTPLTAGDSYVWLDREGSADSVYYLEDLDIDGTNSTHGPVTTLRSTDGPSPRAPRRTKYQPALLLDQLNNAALQNAGDDAQKGWATVRKSTATGSREAAPIETNSPEISLLTRGRHNFDVRLNADKKPQDNSTAGPSPDEQQRTLAGIAALKLGVGSNGWYRVSQSALVAAGLDANADMTNLQLFADGVQVPLKINSANTSGPLAAGDSIEFYGLGLNSTTTDTRQYWLISGSSPGQRINSLSMKVGGPIGGLRSFDYTVERRESLIYFSSLLNGTTDNFFGRVINSAPVSQTLTVAHFDDGSTSTPLLEVALQGATLQDHSVKVSINGREAGTMAFSGFANQTNVFSLTPDLLREGENTVTFERLNGISLVDYVRLTYAHKYQAENNQLNFTAQGRARVTGFTTPRVALLDVTDPTAVIYYQPKMEKAPGGYAFTVNSVLPRTYLAFPDQNANAPAAITRNEPSSLNANSNAADLVIITPSSLKNSVEPLAQLRRSQGLSVIVVDLEDVFDEFSFGARSPNAIRGFLQTASADWTNAPEFVLLVGDGSYDPRNYLGATPNDLMPVRLVDTAVMETVSDDWFVDFDEDGVAEMAIGRLPARNVDEANTMISKILSYLPSNTSQTAVMVADQTDTRTNFDFEAATNDLGTLLPGTIGTQKIFRGSNPANQIHDQIVGAINQGPLLVNYMGHGSVEVWTGGPILSTTDANAFQNGSRLPVFLMMTCLNAYYQNPVRESLAESLLRSNTGGAVAVWASAGMTEPRPQHDVNRALYQQIFNGTPLAMGEAIRRAKIGSADRDVSRTWIFFGDPSMKIR